ncbi:D-2-hydroxyacid dehydrogenase family protein [Yoonia sp.]|uniref:D-2-hydroxyacid dehydrogenase family protein n=1 Tax=Yoonia sp. TaxID=2212373 RepID=UPI0025F2DA1C|nr:D-2-hydroxyacid dehydrogenase family protein [Yoonia sp.]
MKIAVLDDYAGAALRLADWDGLDVTVFSDTISDQAALVARLRPFDVICLMRERTPMPAAVIGALPQLRLIVTSGPRNASIDLDAARAAGVTVCGTPSRKTTTSELTVLMMLALNRRLMPEVAALHGPASWQTGLGRDVAGLTLGLIGLGNIGAQMAVLGRALGMQVCAWSQNLTDARAAEVGVTRMGSLAALMAASDVATVHLVLSPRSEGLLDAAAFAVAKPGQVFINTSRGPIVDTPALLAGLRVGHPAMAGLDVFDAEPLPVDDPLRDADLIAAGTLLLTPHLGYTTEATFALFYRETVAAITAWAAGASIRVLA